MTSAYGRKLNPYRRLQEAGVSTVRKTIWTPNIPDSIGPRTPLIVRFQDLDEAQLIIPGTACLAFTFSLQSSDPNRTVVQNLGRALVRKITVRFTSTEVYELEDADVCNTYLDFWKTPQELANCVTQGIDVTPNRNVTQLRLNAASADTTEVADVAIAKTYKNRFQIPLDFEMLMSSSPFYQKGLKSRLTFELTMNDASRVILANSTDSTFKLEDICLEYEVIQNDKLAEIITSSYLGKLQIPFEFVQRQTREIHKRTDSIWNVYLNVPCWKLKAILLLWVDPLVAEQDFKCNTERFHNPGIKTVRVSVAGTKNHLYADGVHPYHLWSEAKKLFSGGHKRHREAQAVAKDLALTSDTLADFLTNKFCLALDFRGDDDDSIHSTGRTITGDGGGISLQINREPEASGGDLYCYIYLIKEGVMYFEKGFYTGASH